MAHEESPEEDDIENGSRNSDTETTAQEAEASGQDEGIRESASEQANVQ